MHDIVERLRGDYGLPIAFETIPICHEAADEIERLREENQKQKEKIMLLNSMIQTEHVIIKQGGK